MTSFSELEVEQSALGWLGSLGCALAHGPGFVLPGHSRRYVEHATLGASVWGGGVKL